VFCDESHKHKATRSLTFKFIRALRPQNGFRFFTATPISNSIEDLRCYLNLAWDDRWADPAIDPENPWGAIGIHSLDPQYHEENPAPPDEACPRSKAMLNPKLFRALLRTSKLPGTMAVDAAEQWLPAFQSLMTVRRTMASKITAVNAAGENHEVRVGDSVPPFRARTVILAYKSAAHRRRHRLYQDALASMAGSDGFTEGPHPDSDPRGKQNITYIKRLQVHTVSAHAEPFTISYMHEGAKVGVAHINTLSVSPLFSPSLPSSWRILPTGLLFSADHSQARVWPRQRTHHVPSACHARH
jgi:hypothetical protein